MEQMDAYGGKKTIIHFVFRLEPERIACMPNMTELHRTAYHPSYVRTNDARAANCPACKRTDEYKRALEAYGGKLE